MRLKILLSIILMLLLVSSLIAEEESNEFDSTNSDTWDSSNINDVTLEDLANNPSKAKEFWNDMGDSNKEELIKNNYDKFKDKADEHFSTKGDKSYQGLGGDGVAYSNGVFTNGGASLSENDFPPGASGVIALPGGGFEFTYEDTKSIQIMSGEISDGKYEGYDFSFSESEEQQNVLIDESGTIHVSSGITVQVNDMTISAVDNIQIIETNNGISISGKSHGVLNRNDGIIESFSIDDNLDIFNDGGMKGEGASIRYERGDEILRKVTGSFEMSSNGEILLASNSGKSSTFEDMENSISVETVGIETLAIIPRGVELSGFSLSQDNIEGIVSYDDKFMFLIGVGKVERDDTIIVNKESSNNFDRSLINFKENLNILSELTKEGKDSLNFFKDKFEDSFGYSSKTQDFANGNMQIEDSDFGYEGLTESSEYVRIKEGDTEKIYVDGNGDGDVAKLVKKVKALTLEDFEIKQGVREMEMLFTKNDGKLTISNPEKISSSIADFSMNKGFLVDSEKNLVIETGDSGVVYAISKDFSIVYKSPNGEYVTTLSPETVENYLGEKDVESLKFKLFRKENSELFNKLSSKNQDMTQGEYKFLQAKVSEFMMSSNGESPDAELTLATAYFGIGDTAMGYKILNSFSEKYPFHENIDIVKGALNQYKIEENKLPIRQLLQRAGSYYDESNGEDETIMAVIDGKVSDPGFLDIIKRVYDTANPVKFVKAYFDADSTPEIEREYRSIVLGSDILSNYIQEGKTYTEALELIKTDSSVLNKYDYNKLEDGSGAFLTKEDIYKALSSDPTIKAEVKKEAIIANQGQISKDQNNQIALEMAREYRDKGQSKEALQILKPLYDEAVTDTIGGYGYTGETDYMTSEQAQAVNLIEDITGEGTWNLADATKDMITMDAVGEMLNPILLIGMGVATRAGGAVIASTTTGQKLISAISVSKNAFTETAIGKMSIGKISVAKIASEAAWEGVEAGAGFIDPRLEFLTMALDGGIDADYVARNGFDAPNLKSTDKLHISEGESSLVFTADKETLDMLRKQDGAEVLSEGIRIQDDKGNKIFVAGESANWENSNFNSITEIKTEIETLSKLKESEITLQKATDSIDDGLIINSKITETGPIITTNKPVWLTLLTNEVGAVGKDIGTPAESVKKLQGAYDTFKTDATTGINQIDDAIEYSSDLLNQKGIDDKTKAIIKKNIASVQNKKAGFYENNNDPFMAAESYLAASSVAKGAIKENQVEFLQTKGQAYSENSYRPEVSKNIANKISSDPDSLISFFNENPMTMTKTEFDVFAKDNYVSVNYETYKQVLDKSIETSRVPIQENTVIRGININYLENDLDYGSLGPRGLVEKVGADPKDVFGLHGENAARFDRGEITLESLYEGNSPNHNYDVHAKGVDTTIISETNSLGGNKYGVSKGDSGKITLIYDESVTRRALNKENIFRKDGDSTIVFKDGIDKGSVKAIMVGTEDAALRVKSMLSERGLNYVRIVDPDGKDFFIN